MGPQSRWRGGRSAVGFGRLTGDGRGVGGGAMDFAFAIESEESKIRTSQFYFDFIIFIDLFLPD